jgi:uncharacterized protein with PIN domain
LPAPITTASRCGNGWAPSSLPQRDPGDKSRTTTEGRLADPTRFVTDASLDQLARRLRFLGYDVVTHRGARLEELFAVAMAQDRTVLTLSARRPRSAGAVAVQRVARDDEAGAVREVAARHVPSGPRWSRCPVCNEALHARSAFEAVGEVPARIARSGWPLSWCPTCGRWFWPGSHVARMNAWLDRALGKETPR